MAANKAPDLLWPSEGDHKVMAGQLSIHLFLQPLPGFLMLAVRAMPVATRTVDDMRLSAFSTSVDGCTVMIRTAVDDRVNDFAVVRYALFWGVLTVFRMFQISF